MTRLSHESESRESKRLGLPGKVRPYSLPETCPASGKALGDRLPRQDSGGRGRKQEAGEREPQRGVDDAGPWDSAQSRRRQQTADSRRRPSQLSFSEASNKVDIELSRARDKLHVPS